MSPKHYDLLHAERDPRKEEVETPISDGCG